MSRAPEQVRADIAAGHLPDGWAWDHSPSSNTMRSFWPLSRFASAFEAAAEAQLEEATPVTAELMLGAYERVLGPDTCLGDPSALTFAERRQSVNARWTASWGGSPAELVAQAASYGATVTVTETRRTPAGVLRAGAHRVCHPEQFTVVVGMPAADVIPFRAGVSRAGDPLGRVRRYSTIECVLRRAAPARAVLVMDYTTSIEFRLDDTPMDQGATLD